MPCLNWGYGRVWSDYRRVQMMVWLGSSSIILNVCLRSWTQKVLRKAMLASRLPFCPAVIDHQLCYAVHADTEFRSTLGANIRLEQRNSNSSKLTVLSGTQDYLRVLQLLCPIHGPSFNHWPLLWPWLGQWINTKATAAEKLLVSLLKVTTEDIHQLFISFHSAERATCSRLSWKHHRNIPISKPPNSSKPLHRCLQKLYLSCRQNVKQ